MSAASGGGRSLAAARAVVTGASRGIGEAVARALAAEGARVALVARGRDALDRVAASIGENAVAVPCDVSRAADAATAVAEIARTLGTPDILVNAAGVFALAPVHELSPDDFESAVGVNLVAPFRFVRALLPAMRAAGAGHIVTIGSVADRVVYPGNAAYAASKFGARAMHEVLRAETRGSGVRATLVSPGPTDTALWDAIRPADGDGLPSREQMLSAGDVARAVVFALTQPATVNVDEIRLGRS